MAYEYCITLHQFPNSRMDITVSGCEAAYEAWRSAVALMEAVGGRCELWDGNTGEVIEDFGYEDEDEEDFDFDEADLEVGFDPYEGGYTWDC